MSRHARPGPTRAADESMTLINEVYRRPLEPGYQEAAARRAAGAGPGRSVRGTVVLLLLAVVLGAFATTSAMALRRPVPAVIEARQLLEAQIRERTSHAEELRTANAALSAQIVRLQQEAASTDDPELFAELQRDAVAAGLVPVTGPGLRVVLTDGDPAENAAADDGSALVLDIDLQVLVNGLWAAGAEAVAVNGERLTSTTSIRSAGAAVLVDSTALSSPYTVEAIGDAAGMQTALARTSAGQHMASLAQYGISVRMTSQRQLDLPGRGQPNLRSAQVLGQESLDAADEGAASDVAAAAATRGRTAVLGSDVDPVGGSVRHEGKESR